MNKLYLNVGAMKAGTTYLYSLLSDHPELYFTPEKEINFWSDYFLQTNYLNFEQRLKKVKHKINKSNFQNTHKYSINLNWYSKYLMDTNVDIFWYNNLFSNKLTKQYSCDFCNLTSHLLTDHLEIIKTLYPNLKLTYVYRNPIKRLWSHIKFHNEYSNVCINYSELSESDFDRLIHQRHFQMNLFQAKSIKKLSNIFQLNEQLHLIKFEELISQPSVTLKNLCAFLKIDSTKFNNVLNKKPVNQSQPLPPPPLFKKAAERILNEEMNILRYALDV